MNKSLGVLLLVWRTSLICRVKLFLITPYYFLIVSNFFQYLGAWPIVYGEKWSEEKFDFTEMMIRIAQTRSSSIFMSIYVSIDEKNVSKRLIYVNEFFFFCPFCTD